MAGKIKIVVTGANGQLGQCLREIAPKESRYEFVFTDIEELDITDEKAVKAFMAEVKPQWVVNTAAYTAVDRSESEPEAAMRLNADAVGILARESAEAGAEFIHISTDYVFDGTNPHPLSEDEPTNPLGVYGRTKLEGERQAVANPKHVIIRTSWLYSAYGNNFAKTMLRLGREKREIDVVSDQWGSPTSAHDLAKAIMLVIDKPHYGLFNFSNMGATSWAMFAEKILELSGSECVVYYITTEEYPTAAKRPAFSLLDKKKFASTFKANIPEWEASLEEVIKKLSPNEQ